jgi:lysophospholipase L1-like esterase
MLRDAGWTDADGNATFVSVGSQSTGPPDLAPALRNHEGHPGWTTQEVANISATWLPFQPDYILVHLGTNDVHQNHTLNQMLEDMSALLALIKAGAPGATTIVGSIINRGPGAGVEAVIPYNRALPGLVTAAAAGGQKVLFADVNARSGWCTQGNTTLAIFPCTGVHPTSGGYAGMAMAWFEVLAPLLPLP